MRAWLAIAAVLAVWVTGRLVALELDVLRHAMDAALAVAALVVALRFEPGDPPRWAWGSAAIAQILSTLLHLMQAGVIEGASEPLMASMTIVLNLFWVAAIVIFVRNIASSGLAPPWTRAHRVGVGLAVLAALFGFGFVLKVELSTMDARGLDWLHEATNIVSAAADAGVFVGAVLLVRMVWPMAGGRIARPYFLLSFSGAAFLVVEVIAATADTRVYAALDWGAQVWVALADGAMMAAVLTQLELLRDRRDG